ncbi:unnamed protein product [Toxocara canis]|uniref:RRP15-like protein n=1 Tax=Toxocara canis TaxID=6265 RepID=A0A183U5J9_TOXCA|nr:unnamed protein product [Toxocara canis]
MAAIGRGTKKQRFKIRTIFEVQSGSKAQPAAVMKEKRKVHQKYIREKVAVQFSAECQSHPLPEESAADKGAADDADVASEKGVEDEADEEEMATVIMGCDNVKANTFQEVIRSSKFVPRENDSLKRKEKGRKRKAEELERERREHFIAYAPRDAVSERALAVDRGFDAEAKANAVDICADDVTEMYKQQKRKKWSALFFTSFIVLSR